MTSINHSSNVAHNTIEWKQNDDIIKIKMFELCSDTRRDYLQNLLTELSSKNIMFTLKISKNKQLLLVYSKEDINKSSNEELLTHFTRNYPLRETIDAEDFIIPPIKKTIQKDNLLQFQMFDGSQLYCLALSLESFDSKSYSFSKRLTQFLDDLVKTDTFSVIVTHIPTSLKTSGSKIRWGLMLVTYDKIKEEVEKKEKMFQRLLKANATKLQCKMSFVTKKNIVRHNANFRFFVPWIRIDGDFTEIIHLRKLLSLEHKDSINSHMKISAKPIDAPIPEVQQIVTMKHTSNIKQPFPSVRAPTTNTMHVGENSRVIERKQTRIKSLEDKHLVSNLDDISIPVPKTLGVVFDAEYLKVRISKMFREFEFKETVIFEDNFDLVLRKGSFYVFVKFFKDLLSNSEAHKVIETLSSIAGLRNQFLCIVVADAIEENSVKTLNEFNVLHLTLNDVLLDDALKSKIYNTVLA